MMSRKGDCEMKILITGGTLFVSQYLAEYFVAQGQNVYVLNRNTRAQVSGVQLIQADRHTLTDELRGYDFDVVIDTAYTAEDVNQLLDALDGCGDYVLISSSAVYPESAVQPFREDTPLAENCHWGAYGTNKIAAETVLLLRKPDAFILRPPYLYGPMNNVYREAFVFDCALAGRPFYLPGDGALPLQFFHIRDLCRMIDVLLREKPMQRIYNVGNPEPVTVRDWVQMCYRAAGKEAAFIMVNQQVDPRGYFCFRDYAYCLDTSAQQGIMPILAPMQEGLQEAFDWYIHHQEDVNKRPYLDYIIANLEQN